MRMTGGTTIRSTSGALLLMLFVVAAVHAQSSSDAARAPTSSDPNTVVGLWSTEPDEGEWSRVEVYRCADRYCGRIVWLSHPLYDEAGDWGEVGDPKVDWKNPDEELRSQPIVGLEIMHSFRLDDGKWKDGRIYDPDNGKTYRSELTLAADGQILRVRGYVKIALIKIGRTTEWTRVSDSGP